MNFAKHQILLLIGADANYSFTIKKEKGATSYLLGFAKFYIFIGKNTKISIKELKLE